MSRIKPFFIASFFLVFFFLLPGKANATTYYVSPDGSDNNSGTESQPFKTVQKGIDSTTNGDTVYITQGIYNLNNYSKTITYSLSLIGDNQHTTVLENGGTFTFHNSLTVNNLQFSNYSRTVFHPLANSSETIDGVSFDNCIFKQVPEAISDSSSTGLIKNFTVKNCSFFNIESNSTSVFAIRLQTGNLDNIRVENNRFENIHAAFYNPNETPPRSPYKSAMAIYIGSNETRTITNNIFIANNIINGVSNTAPYGYQCPENIYSNEVHGVLAYGKNIHVLNNYVGNLNSADDHEAIYLKADGSVIASNIVFNGGSLVGGGDISIKGDPTILNVVYGNKITDNGNYPGIGIYTIGPVLMKNNYVKKTAGWFGIYSYNLLSNSLIANNYIEVRGIGIDSTGAGIKIYCIPELSIVDNVFISYESNAIEPRNCSDGQFENNIVCEGDNCSGLLPPNPTCQNLGFACCSACQSGSHSQYNATCTNEYSPNLQSCCDECLNSNITPSPTPQPCPADLNGDGQVNQEDFKQVLNLWGQSCLDCQEDSYQDNKINALDLAVVIKDWGECE